MLRGWGNLESYAGAHPTVNPPSQAQSQWIARHFSLWQNPQVTHTHTRVTTASTGIEKTPFPTSCQKPLWENVEKEM